MSNIVINKESLPSRCEICHKPDSFDSEKNYCSRCNNILETIDKGRLAKTNNVDAAKRISFWQRQSTLTPTNKQQVFDIILGIILPIACLVFDPIIFKSGTLNDGLLSKINLFAYTFCAVEILTLIGWLLFGKALKNIKAVGEIVAGILYSGAICSLILALLMTPISVVGLIILIGIFGFTPYFSAFTYLRQGRRIFKNSSNIVPEKRILLVIVGIIVSLIIPFMVHMTIKVPINRSLNIILKNDKAHTEEAIKTLKRYRTLANTRAIYLAYHSYQNRENKDLRESLAYAYKEITGEDLTYEAD